jgi:hypothetical protein
MTLVLGGAALGGCAARGTVGYTATYSEPSLAYVSPGVYAVEDVDEPMFYTDGFYWRLHGGVWYRSNYYDRGWAYATPPRAVFTINQPYAYVRFHGNRHFQARRGVRTAPGGVRVRDHRGYWR